MADDGLTLHIDAALAESLRARAEAAGQSVEDYALGIVQRAVEQPGFGENDVAWTAPVKRDAAYWRELEAICDEADRTGGVPWEQVEARLRNFGQKR